MLRTIQKFGLTFPLLQNRNPSPIICTQLNVAIVNCKVNIIIVEGFYFTGFT
jgi:hypothetical protein